MLQTLKTLVESKKFVTASFSALAVGLGHFGLNVPVEVMLAMISPLMIYIGAQGWADSGAGKELAKTQAKIEDKRLGRSEFGFMSMRLAGVLATAGIVLGLAANCGPKTTAALHQFTTCAESAAAKDLTPTVESILTNGGPTWKQQLTALAGTFGPDVLDCAVNAAKSIFLQKFGGPVDTDAVLRADEWLKHGGA